MRSNSSVWLRARENAKLFSITMDQHQTEAGERKSRSGILIPATANVDRRLVWAEVIQVGPTVRNVEAGDQVLFAPDAGFEVEIRGDEYLILRERDVHALASKREGGQTGLYL